MKESSYRLRDNMDIVREMAHVGGKFSHTIDAVTNVSTFPKRDGEVKGKILSTLDVSGIGHEKSREQIFKELHVPWTALTRTSSS